MCDHCLRRDRAYDALSTEDRKAVDSMTAIANTQLDALAKLAQAHGDHEAFDNAYLEFGDALDILLRIQAPSIPDTPPDWA